MHTREGFLSELKLLIVGDIILGKAGISLKCNHAMSLAHAFGDMIFPDKGGHFAIGYDVRSSSSSLAEAISIGLRAGGHHTIHIGACTTPMLEWFIHSTQCHGGIMIAGGAAPADWNGLAFYGPKGQPVQANKLLQADIEPDLNQLFTGACVPTTYHKQPLHSYAAKLRQRLKPNGHLKLCLDMGNGLAGREFDAIISHYHNLRVWRIGFSPDPSFPGRGPNPASELAIQGLKDCVRTNGCHLGAALDADGTMLAIVDEFGRHIPAEIIGAVLAHALQTNWDKKKVLCAPDIQPTVSKFLDRAGFHIGYFSGSPASAAQHMQSQGEYEFYFDSKGNYVFRDFPGSSNGLLALIELINHLCKTDKPLSMLTGIVDPQ